VSPTVHSLLYILGCILAAWLYLACGISCTTTTRILKFVETIINVTNTPFFSLNLLLPIISGHSNHSFSLPHNVHTAITTLSIQPQCHDLAKQLRHYLYFFSFLFLFFYLGLTTQKEVQESVMSHRCHTVTSHDVT